MVATSGSSTSSSSPVITPPKFCEIYKDILALVAEGVEPRPEEYPGNKQLFHQKHREWLERKAANQRQKLFYNAIRFLLERDFSFKDKAKPPPADDNGGEPVEDLLDAYSEDEQGQFLSVAGLLMAEGFKDPTFGKTGFQLSGPGDYRSSNNPADWGKHTAILIAAGFVGHTVAAVKEYKTNAAVLNETHRRLRAASTTTRKGRPAIEFGARQLAEIGRQLIEEGISAGDSQFGPRFERALSTSLSGAIEGRSSAIDIDLPDLEENTEADIIKDNVMALSAVYFSAMLEELKFFSVMDKVVEQFMNGALPVSRGKGGDQLYEYFRQAPNRINEVERRGLYARSFGLAQGSVEEPTPNREFNDLWIRFLSAVSFNGRELNSTERRLTSDEQVFKSGRDLAVNVSLHGYGLAHFAAIELQNLIKQIKDNLSTRDILQAYGVRDVWQLVERVSNMYLGGAVNSVRQRTMAQAGSKVIQWLASQAGSLAGAHRVLNLDDELRSQVERWLAVTGTPDATVERYSEPVALQQQRTIPDFGQMAGGDLLRDAIAKVGNLPQVPQA
jgi:hypothetical protein